MVSAFVEAWLRKPTYAGHARLRDDTDTLRGWWRNRFARVIVNFMLTNIGTALAVWIAGANLCIASVKTDSPLKPLAAPASRRFG